MRKLSLSLITIQLPALQPVATRLHSLNIKWSDLLGSADGFLSVGWTALTSLDINSSRVTDGVLRALHLPALKLLRINTFPDHRDEWLQPDQLCCPQLCSLALQANCSLPQADEGSRQCCSLLHLTRLTALTVKYHSGQGALDLALPASLMRLTVFDMSGSTKADLRWALLDAAKCIEGGAQLRSLTCTSYVSSSHPEGMPWGASSISHYKELGGQLLGLTDLSVHGKGPTLPSALGMLSAQSHPPCVCSPGARWHGASPDLQRQP